MTMQDRTKIMFAEQLETMLKTMPLDKIRIVDLCQQCGAAPPTFYYHFHDKYELVGMAIRRHSYCNKRFSPLPI